MPVVPISLICCIGITFVLDKNSFDASNTIEDSVIDQKYGQKNIIVAQSFNDGNMIRLI